MKTNKEPLRAAMDRRLSFLDDLPSCRAALYSRIEKEAPVVKKKLSVGVVFAMVLVLLATAALAAELLLSPRASAVRVADQALEQDFGITAEMQTFFSRREEALPEGGFRVTYTGAGSLEYVLGTYTALVKDQKADVSWSREGADVSGGYEADAWGLEQLRQMMADGARDDKTYLQKAEEISAKHAPAGAEDAAGAAAEPPVDPEEEKNAALNARKVSEEEMIAIGREFVISSYSLSEEQVSRMELYTNSLPGVEPNSWYCMVNGAPCFQVEFLLYSEYEDAQQAAEGPRPRAEMDGFYNVFVNVETGAVESFEYNSALNGIG